MLDTLTSLRAVKSTENMKHWLQKHLAEWEWAAHRPLWNPISDGCWWLLFRYGFTGSMSPNVLC